MAMGAGVVLEFPAYMWPWFSCLLSPSLMLLCFNFSSWGGQTRQGVRADISNLKSRESALFRGIELDGVRGQMSV